MMLYSLWRYFLTHKYTGLHQWTLADRTQCGMSGLPDWEGEAQLAQDKSVPQSLASPSDVSASRSYHDSFMVFFHVSFNEETAGSAAYYKTQAN